MGFVKRNYELENYLDTVSIDWKLLSDKKYSECSRRWRESFECEFKERRVAYAWEAIDRLNTKLPFEAYLLHFAIGNPTQRYSRCGYAYGYEISEIRNIESEIFCSFELIITDRDFEFTCIFENDWPDCIESYCESSQSRTY